MFINKISHHLILSLPTLFKIFKTPLLTSNYTIKSPLKNNNLTPLHQLPTPLLPSRSVKPRKVTTPPQALQNYQDNKQHKDISPRNYPQNAGSHRR